MIFSRNSISPLCFAGLIVSAVFAQPAVAAKLYKWVDDKGTVHYSDKLPPEASRNAHEELNKRGQTTDKVSRAKSEQERLEEHAAIAAEEEKRRRQAEIEAKQRIRDQILLDTFTTERDLVLTRDDRLSAVDSLINLTNSNNQRLKTQADETQAKVDAIASKGREVPENLTKQLENLNDQLAKNLEYIDAKQTERRGLVEQFDADLKRFRELKGIEPPADVADPKPVKEGMATADPPPPPPATE